MVVVTRLDPKPVMVPVDPVDLLDMRVSRRERRAAHPSRRRKHPGLGAHGYAGEQYSGQYRK